MQKVLDVTQEKREAHVHHDRQTDDLAARSEVSEWVVICHPETVRERPAPLNRIPSDTALAAALELDRRPGIHVLACDTDGIDGAAEVAGAVAGPATLTEARRLGLDPEGALARNDAHSFVGAAGSQIVTGPTLTNVNDFRAILIVPEGS